MGPRDHEVARRAQERPLFRPREGARKAPGHRSRYGALSRVWAGITSALRVPGTAFAG